MQQHLFALHAPGRFLRSHYPTVDPGSDHHRTHIGECSTIVVAEEMRARGVAVLICMDDTDGRRLARGNRLDVGDTAELVIEMVCGGAITEANGDRLWRHGLFPDRREAWPGFRERLERHGFPIRPR